MANVDNVSCPFCAPAPDRILLARPTCIAIGDAYPLTPGHVLVIPRRHVASIFALSDEEQGALWSAVREARTMLAAE
ncbi:MAG: HIT family protein, partial [Planctomycetota bacterium]